MLLLANCGSHPYFCENTNSSLERVLSMPQFRGQSHDLGSNTVSMSLIHNRQEII